MVYCEWKEIEFLAKIVGHICKLATKNKTRGVEVAHLAHPQS